MGSKYDLAASRADPVDARVCAPHALLLSTEVAQARTSASSHLLGACDLIRQAKVAEGFGSEEGGDLFDLGATQGEHVDAVRREDSRFLVPGVAAEGELRVRACAREAPALHIGERPAPQEGANRFAAAVPGRQRR